MPIWTITAAAVLLVAMLASVFRNVRRAPSSVELRERLGLTPGPWSAVGVLEAPPAGLLALAVIATSGFATAP